MADVKTDVLAKVKGYFEQAVQSPAWQAWRKEAREAFAFYDGEQWSAEEKAALAEHGQPAIVINKIAAKVDNIAGTWRRRARPRLLPALGRAGGT